MQRIKPPADCLHLHFQKARPGGPATQQSTTSDSSQAERWALIVLSSVPIGRTYFPSRKIGCLSVYLSNYSPTQFQHPAMAPTTCMTIFHECLSHHQGSSYQLVTYHNDIPAGNARSHDASLAPFSVIHELLIIY